jgi:hypothetical protein
MCIPLRTKTKSYKQLHYAPLPIPIGEKWSLSGWWYTYPSEKYEFVSWDYSSQHISEKRPRPCDQFQMVPNVRNPRAHAMAHVSQQHQGLKNDGTTGTLL